MDLSTTQRRVRNAPAADGNNTTGINNPDVSCNNSSNNSSSNDIGKTRVAKSVFSIRSLVDVGDTDHHNHHHNHHNNQNLHNLHDNDHRHHGVSTKQEIDRRISTPGELEFFSIYMYT